MNWLATLTGLSVPTSQAGETRSQSLENPSVPLDSDAAYDLLGATATSFTGETVNVETVLGIPAVWAAVDMVASSVASLPIQVYRKTSDGKREKVADNDPLQRILHDQVNDDYLTSVEWRRGLIMSLMMRGRSLTAIQRNRVGRVSNLYPLNIDDIDVRLKGHRKLYVHRSQIDPDTGKPKTWEAGEVIDLVWMPNGKPGGFFDPIKVHANTFGLAIAADRYASRAFRNGGVSPLKLKLDKLQGAAAQKATQAISSALSNGGMVLPLFGEMDLEPIGFDPSKMTMLELKRQLVVEISRIFRLPPVTIQSLEFGTYSNSEQQALAFVKTTIQPIVEQLEEELLAKLWSDKNRTHFVKFNLDGLTRGDLAARYNAYRTAIHGGFLTPNEVRGLDDRESAGPDGDKLWMQGANNTLENLASQSLTPPPADPLAQPPATPPEAK